MIGNEDTTKRIHARRTNTCIVVHIERLIWGPQIGITAPGVPVKEKSRKYNSGPPGIMVIVNMVHGIDCESKVTCPPVWPSIRYLAKQTRAWQRRAIDNLAGGAYRGALYLLHKHYLISNHKKSILY